ncbi:MAG: hypothetical protein IJ637_02375 [Prevotella sp.]|nr:hypothetical protein [Prevotella sp.]
MARRQLWQDDYWLLLLQLFLKKPTGVKPVYSRDVVNLSMELHISPQALTERMRQIDTLDTPRIERIWRDYAASPRRLARAVRLLREMTGFNSGGDFFEGVDVNETFERDFRPLVQDSRLTPVALTLILDEYFRLTPITMVADTPEVQALARLLQVPVALVVEVLGVFQHCDPYLGRRDACDSPLLAPCQEIWQRYGNGDVQQLADYAEQLKEYYK